MAKTELLAISSPGSRALKNTKIERYCRLRASLQPRAQAYREAGWETSDDGDAYNNACRLERRPGVRARIEYLLHQGEELIAEKRRRIEAQLWAIHEADIGAFWETYEAAKTGKDGKLATDQEGKMLTVRKQRAKLEQCAAWPLLPCSPQTSASPMAKRTGDASADRAGDAALKTKVKFGLGPLSKKHPGPLPYTP